MGNRRVRARTLGVALAAAVAITGMGPAALAADDLPGAPIINIADTDATAETNSLFKYLLDQQGDGALFGHQHTTDNGITFAAPNGTSSDVLAGTGDHPGIFGWDTLVLEGLEGPGTPTNTPEQNVRALADGMINADRLGGINTMSAHMRNFVTGQNFTDSSGRVVSQILPGGPKNAEFNAYLDLIAATASLTVDADGNLIPIIFRPFHENTGSWFWWGAAHATAGEYKEIFRYTVEYLRDTKNVSNLLYAYSPNGSFGGDPTRYLATYPGDAWIDILGYDSYENSNAPENSDAWIASVIPDLAMIADLADERGKIAALTEFGRNGDRTIRETGNKSLTYYTDLLAAIKADPKARRIAYMQTWSNWELGQFYVPYPAYADSPAHEMFADFLDFYHDDYTVFADDIAADAFTRAANAAPARPTVRLVSPADGVRITTPATTVRVKATTAVPDRVYFTVAGNPTQRELTLGADGYYSGTWEIGAENLTNDSATVTASATYAGQTTIETSVSVILGEAPTLPVGVIDDFEGYNDDAALRAAYSFNSASADDLTLSSDLKGSGEHGAAFAYDFTAREYGGFGKVLPAPQDWSAFNRLNAWLLPDGSDQKLVLQMKAGGQTFEAYPSLAGTEPSQLSIHFADFRPPAWDSANADKRLTVERLTSVTEFFVYINKVGAPSPGRIVVDDIVAVAGAGDPLPPTDPTDPTDPFPGLVDDFESYADDAALRAAWSRPGAQTLSLSADVKATGNFGAAFPFSAAFDEFSKSVDADWSAFNQLSMWVQPDGEQKLVLQLVAGGFYYDAVVLATGSEPIEANIPFSAFTPAPFQGRDPALRPSPAELADVQQLVMFIEPTAGSTSETGTLYLDDIRATTAEPEPEPVLAASTVSISIRKPILFSWQRTAVTVSVQSEGAAVPTGAVTLQVGDQTFTGQLDAKGRVKVKLADLPRGVHAVTASYLGDASTAGSSSQVKQIHVVF